MSIPGHSKIKKPLLIFRPLLLFAFFNLFIVFSLCASPHFPKIKKCLFVNPSHGENLSKQEANDLKSLRNSIFVSGIKFEEIKVDSILAGKLKDYDLVILPVAAAKELSHTQLAIVKEALGSGTNLLFDGVSPLNEEIGITLYQKSQPVNRVHFLEFPKIPLYWTASSLVNPVDTSGRKYKVLCVEDSTQKPIVISGFSGKGQFVYFSTYFDPNTSKGYSRFPFLIETLNAVFAIKPMAERKTMEMYFDPGLRDTVTIEHLVHYWRENKIKRIHVGGWYYDEEFDYAKLIKLCHENGILVYCWFETPMISRTFWDAHPQWREKTAYDKDANIDWRLLMNLADSSCRRQIFKEWDAFLMSHDFDGVNLAELYFEPSPIGPNNPENFTPMNQQVRSGFKKTAGFDPAELFNEKSPHYWKNHPDDWHTFAAYRKKLCFELKQYCLDYLATVRERKKDCEIMLTVIDVSLSPELADFIGEDTKNSLKLYKKFGVAMQIEDPSNWWGTTPERYEKMGNYYRKYIKEPRNLLFDCNVVVSHEKGEGGFPAEKPSGEEIRQVTFNMLSHILRPVFYCEETINAHDWQNISCTLARDTKVSLLRPGAWSVWAKNTIILHTGITGAPLKLDGHPWFAGEGEAVIIPQGEHTLEMDTVTSPRTLTRMIAVSGELISAGFGQDHMEFSYSEESVPCYVILDKQPVSIRIDNQVTNCPVYKHSDSEFTLKLPAGRHNVKISKTLSPG